MHNKLGFTLFETLVALFVFSLLILVVFQGFDIADRTNARVTSDAKENDFPRLVNLRHQLLQDWLNLKRRSTTNELGQKMPAIVIEDGRSLRFVRGGLPVHKTLYPGGMQLIDYQFADNNLVRLSWPYLDLAPDAKPHRQVVLTGVSSVAFEALSEKGDRSRFWPISDNWKSRPGATAVWDEVPLVLELNVSLLNGESFMIRLPGLSS